MELKAIIIYLVQTKCQFSFNEKNILCINRIQRTHNMLIQYNVNIYSHTRPKARIQIRSLCLLDFKNCCTFSVCFAYDPCYVVIFKQN